MDVRFHRDCFVSRIDDIICLCIASTRENLACTIRLDRHDINGDQVHEKSKVPSWKDIPITFEELGGGRIYTDRWNVHGWRSIWRGSTGNDPRRCLDEGGETRSWWKVPTSDHIAGQDLCPRARKKSNETAAAEGPRVTRTIIMPCSRSTRCSVRSYIIGFRLTCTLTMPSVASPTNSCTGRI